MNLDHIPKFAKKAIFRIIDNEAVLVTPDDGNIIVINETASEILKLINQNKKIDEIIDKIYAMYEKDIDTIKNDTISFIKELTECGIII